MAAAWMGCTKAQPNPRNTKAPDKSGAFDIAIAFAFLAVIPAGNLLCTCCCLFFAVILEPKAKAPAFCLHRPPSRPQNETSMRPLLIALCLTTLATPTLQAQSASDLADLHYLKTPISKLNPPDRHEILNRLQIVASQLRAEAVTTNGQQSFFVQGIGSPYCGNVNCSVWIFDSNHKILLDTFAEGVGYLPTTHNGRNDILISRHESAWEQDILRYKFDGTHYRKVRCADVLYADSDGKPYKSPHITPTPCRVPHS
jgi:hypothetical protein